MATPSKSKALERTQDDPGVSNDPKSNTGGYDAHAWHSLNQIFERLGKMDQKIDQLSDDQIKLKNSVDKYDDYVKKIIYMFGGIVVALTVLWFIYDEFLKDHIEFT